jgi:hypothetical protein
MVRALIALVPISTLLTTIRRLATSMQFYRSLLGIQSVYASARGTTHLLHIVYDVPMSPARPLARSVHQQSGKPDSETVELVLEFDPISRRLADAQVSKRTSLIWLPDRVIASADDPVSRE